MRSLTRKLLRDLWYVKGQALAIAAVVACGVATFIMATNTLESLQTTLDTYYGRYRFAHVFASMKRAPAVLAQRIAELPGVTAVDPRVVKDVTLDVPGLSEPAIGRLISLPEAGHEGLNQVYLRRGRMVDPTRGNEVLASEGFCTAHNFVPGDQVTAILNGRKRQLTIVGVALSPEYIFQLRPGDAFPDEKRFGIFWIGRKPLEAAFDMKEAFNDVTLALARGAPAEEVLRRLDLLTEPYGGLGSFDRENQTSNRFLSDEMKQLKTMAMVAPSIFLSVAAFLLNVVLTRIIRAERDQIAVLKAFGYTNLSVGFHYLKFALLIVAVGVIAGTIFGTWMSRGLTALYGTVYHFPLLHWDFSPRSIATAWTVAGAVGVVGTLAAVRRAVQLPPAEAMRPEPPTSYRQTIVERLGLTRLLSPPERMILRHLERRPIQSLTGLLGISLAVAVLVMGRFGIDALDYMIDVQFFVMQRQDVSLAYVEPKPARTLDAIRALPGVVNYEPFRMVPAKIRAGHHVRRVGITGIPPNAQLNRLLDSDLRPVEVPPTGVLLTQKLAEVLDVHPGQIVRLETLEQKRLVRDVPVTGIVKTFIGTGVYMQLEQLNRLMQEAPSHSGAYLTVDPTQAEKLYQTLKNTPGVASVNVKRAALQSFRDTIAANMMVMTMFNILFACIIAFGVVYNAAQISLAERSRELASLRVLGFTRGEISYILLGELAILTVLALPLGFAIGNLFCYIMVQNFDNEMYELPLVVSLWTFGFASTVVLTAAVASGLVVRRRLDHLDLVAVLKSRE